MNAAKASLKYTEFARHKHGDKCSNSARAVNTGQVQWQHDR